MSNDPETQNNESDAPAAEEDRMMKWFSFQHLPPHLAEISRPFYNLALSITSRIEPGPERTVALRKLLEGKDAAVRAFVYPGE